MTGNRRKHDELASHEDKPYTLETYIRDFYIEPKNESKKKYPSAIFLRKQFMGGIEPLEFWRWLFEPECPTEGIRQKGDSVTWPYADRLVRCATAFMSIDQEDQDYILRARKIEKPIWWRGENISAFKPIAREAYRFGQLHEAEKIRYVKNLIAKSGVNRGIA